jgi:transposase-like protein
MKDEVNIFEFSEQFPDEQACITFLEKSLWEDGEPTSPFTGLPAYRIGSRPGVYKCKQKRQNFSVRHGTIFEESRLPLKKWFFAIFLLHSLKKGISSVQIAKYLGITQKSAWFMLQRIRYAVEHEAFKMPLSGIVEVDETYHGGRRPGKRGRGAGGKTPILGIIERGGEVRCEAVPDVKARTVGPIVRENVVLGSTLMTDEFGIYPSIASQGYTHKIVNHGRKEYVKGDAHTNSVEGFWSHLKRGIKGIYIQVSRKHLNKYCKEYEFRFNHRHINDFDRFSAWFDRCLGRLTYQQLIA